MFDEKSRHNRRGQQWNELLNMLNFGAPEQSYKVKLNIKTDRNISNNEGNFSLKPIRFSYTNEMVNLKQHCKNWPLPLHFGDRLQNIFIWVWGFGLLREGIWEHLLIFNWKWEYNIIWASKTYIQSFVYYFSLNS